MSARRDGGLSRTDWQRFYTPMEVEEILAASTTMIASGNLPIHIRMYTHSSPAPTVILAHGIAVYSLLAARSALPLHRAGFNVVHFDLPGLGQSGGPRGGCTIDDFIDAWGNVIDFAHELFGAPLFVMGIAEDAVTGYYAAANRPTISAMSLHILFEYGEPGGAAVLGSPWRERAIGVGLGALLRTVPEVSIRREQLAPLDKIFGGATGEDYLGMLEDDPLCLERIQVRFGHGMVSRRSPDAAFEDCRTPVQIIASEQNDIWSFDLVVRNYERLGGEKELVTLPETSHWDLSAEFNNMYCEHVVKWFRAIEARTSA